MIIGFDASRAFTKNRTGTENYSYQILSQLTIIDHNNNYNIYLRPPVNLNEIKSSLNWPANFKLITIPFPKLWTQMGLAIQTFKDKLDVLFIPSHTLPLIHKPGLKTVVTVHDLGAEYLPTTHQLKQRLYLNLMTHYQLKSANHLIAVSKATKRDLINKIGIAENKISVVYEGYNEKLFKPVTGNKLKEELKIYNLEPGSYFLFVGTIQPRKNLERLIKAYNQYLRGVARAGASHRAPAGPTYVGPRTSDGAGERQDPEQNSYKLVLAGSKGWLADEIYKLPQKLGIKNKIKFLGYVPDDKLPALYSGAKALLFPSLFEGFGLPILEAFACNCPVLTSNTSSCPEVAGDAAILVDPYSIESIAQGILEISSQQVATKLTKLGLKQVKKFSWQKAAQETLTIISN